MKNNLWYENTCIYHFFSFGVCNAPFNNTYQQPINRILELEKWIPHLIDMNCNTILLSPIFESKSHGYDTTDYYKIDSRLGTNENFKDIVNKLHNNNIKVVLDGVFNHCGRDFFAFQDILNNGINSEYCDWFSSLSFDKSNSLGDPFTYDTWAGYEELPKFNLKNNQIKEYLLNATKYWIEYFNIDGIRLDACDCLDFNFIKEIRNITDTLKQDFWLMGEIVHGDYNNWIGKNKLHSVTNYEIFKGFYSSHNDQNLFEIAHSLSREFDNKEGVYKHFLPYNFVDNHDQSRLASLVDKPQYLYTIYILLFTIPGIPSIYYGSEWGLTGIKGPTSDFSIRPYIDVNTIKVEEENLENVIKKLIKIREENPALHLGSYKQIYIEYHKPFVFERKYNNQTVLIIINPREDEEYLNLSSYCFDFYDALNDTSISKNDLNNLKINPYWGRILISK